MKYWSKLTQSITPYVPGEQPKEQLIKLNTNENPYPPTPEVAAAIQETLSSLNLYPEPESDALSKAIAEAHGVPRDRVFVGNGSDEVLALAFMAFFGSEKKIAFPDVTYSFYPVFARLFSIPYIEIPLESDFSIEPSKMRGAGVVLANPNAPTSLYMALDRVESILKANANHVVIVDEAYIAFGGESAVALIDRYPNLLVVKTFSKSHSLAGLRVGYALGQEHLIEGLTRIKNSFNSYPLDRLAQAGASAAVKQIEHNKRICAKIIQTRERTKNALIGMGFTMPAPAGNFIFATHKDVAANELYRALRANNILVRHFKLTRINNYLRITIGAEDDMAAFVSCVKKIIQR